VLAYTARNEGEFHLFMDRKKVAGMKAD